MVEVEVGWGGRGSFGGAADHQSIKIPKQDKDTEPHTKQEHKSELCGRRDALSFYSESDHGLTFSCVCARVLMSILSVCENVNA